MIRWKTHKFCSVVRYIASVTIQSVHIMFDDKNNPCRS